MNKFGKLFVVIVVLLGVMLSACGVKPASETSAAAMPTATTLAPTMAANTPTPAAEATAQPMKADWSKIPDPVYPWFLPADLDGSIRYENPPENCAAANDPEVTCSTREGQATKGDFTLRAGYARALTGDEIAISRDGKSVVSLPDATLNHTLWILVNVSDADIKLSMDAPDGSWRGNFSASWTPDMVALLRDNTLQHFLVGPNPIPTPNPVGPTPVVNCGNRNACDKTNTMVGVWDGKSWHWSNGIYNDGLLGNNWQPAK